MDAGTGDADATRRYREEMPDDQTRNNMGSTFDAEAYLENLKKSDRAAAERMLLERKYRELGALFVSAGGTAIDSKKPKDWLINQILWRIFDFDRGHEAIRTRGAREA